jgi:hypothetical protein
MAAGTLAVQKMTLGLTAQQGQGVYTGFTPSFAAATATDGDKVTPGNASKTFIICKLASGGPIYVKLVAQQANSSGELCPVGDATVTKGIPVTTTAPVYVGPLDDPSLRDANGAVTIISSLATNLTLAAVELSEHGRG